MPVTTEVIKELAPPVAEALSAGAREMWSRISGQMLGDSVAALRRAQEISVPELSAPNDFVASLKIGAQKGGISHEFPGEFKHLDATGGDWTATLPDRTQWTRAFDGSERITNKDLSWVQIHPDGRFETASGAEKDSLATIVNAERAPRALPAMGRNEHLMEDVTNADKSVTLLGDGTVVARAPFGATHIFGPTRDTWTRGDLAFATYRNSETGVETTHFTSGDKLVVSPKGQATWLTDSAKAGLFHSAASRNMLTGTVSEVHGPVRIDTWRSGLQMQESPAGLVMFSKMNNGNFKAMYGPTGDMHPSQILPSIPDQVRIFGKFEPGKMPTREIATRLEDDAVYSKLSNQMMIAQSPDGGTHVYTNLAGGLPLFSVERSGIVHVSPLQRVMNRRFGVEF